MLEFFNLGITRLDLTRLSYHYTVGVFNIRDHRDEIEVIDEEVDHLSIRIFRPTKLIRDEMPTVIYYHGGGHFVGSADIFEPVTYLLANSSGCQVIYIEFRLIPEIQYPTPLNDAYHITKHLIKNSRNYKIDLNNLIMMGDSAGGNLATVVSAKLITENIARPKLQVLIYPILQMFDFTLPSYRINMPKRILGTIHSENYKNFLHYLTGHNVDDSVFSNGHTSGMDKDRFSQFVNVNLLPVKFMEHNLSKVSLLNDTTGRFSRLSDILLSKELSPLLVDDETLMRTTPANTILVTAELDILRDDGFIYAERMRRVGKRIEHVHYDNMFHGVLNLIFGPLEFRQSRVLLNDVSKAIQKVLKE